MKLALLVAGALGAGVIVVTTPPRPPFPGPVASAPEGKRLAVVSSKPASPNTVWVTSVSPGRACGYDMVASFTQVGRSFSLFGRDAASARCLVVYSSLGRPLYAFDFRNYVRPPGIRPGEREFVYEEVVWAREANGVLYVENAHWTYARSSYGQNAYITAFDLETKKRLWRSKALVANARTFVATPRFLVTGYGFTAEDDWLYLLDRRTGSVVERLRLPSAPERITRRGDRITVRTYDHVVVVRLRES